MAQSIANLQAAVLDGSAGTNSEVKQLNLLTSGTVQTLQMQETANNVMTSLLEQQTIANKIQRDTLADHLNYETQREQYLVAEGPQWGGAAQAITAARLQ
jgi:PBP1b-binding outer membrane lipoprotein LpoB